MKKQYYIFIIIPLCIIILFFACSGKEVDGPGIDFKKEIHEFGQINEGERIKYTFVFTNNGNENLIIEDVRPTCGCTLAGDYDKEVKPGDSGEIPIELKTDGFQGNISKIIRVITNIPTKKEIILTLRGTVYTPLVITPKLLWLGQVNNATGTLSGSFTITNNTKSALKIINVTPSNNKVIVKTTTVKADKEYKIEVTINPPFGTGKIDETVAIQTNIPDGEIITLRYSYNVQAEIVVYPQAIIFNSTILDKETERTINVENYFPESISIKNPQVMGGKVDYAIEEQAPGKRFQIKLKFPAGFKFEDKTILIFTFQIVQNQKTTVYNIPIKLSKDQVKG